MRFFLSLLAGIGIGVVGIGVWYLILHFAGREIGYLGWGIAAGIGYVMYYINGQQRNLWVGIVAALLSISTMISIRWYPLWQHYQYIASLDILTENQWHAMYENDIVEYASVYSGMNFEDYKVNELSSKDMSFIDLYADHYLSGGASVRFEFFIWFVMLLVAFHTGRGKKIEHLTDGSEAAKESDDIYGSRKEKLGVRS